MSDFAFKEIKVDRQRVTIGAVAFFSVGIGSAIQWGLGGMLLTVGLCIWLDMTSERVLERVTGTKIVP